MQLKFPSLFAATLLTWAALPASAQVSRTDLLDPPELRPALSEERGVGDVLDSLPREQADTVRQAFAESETPGFDKTQLTAYTRAWIWEEYDVGIGFEFSDADLEGNVILCGYQAVDGKLNLRVQKIDGAENVGPPAVLWTVSTPFFGDNIFDMAVDLDGDIYVAGANFDSPGGKLIKISSEGFVVWQRSYDIGGGGSRLARIVLDSEGIPFVAARVGNGNVDTRIMQISPATGVIGWSTDIRDSQAGLDGSLGENIQLTIDRSGRVYTAVASSNDLSQSLIARLDGGTGKVLWWQFRAIRLDDVPPTRALAADDDGNVYLVGSNDGPGTVEKFSPEGQLLWSRGFDFGGTSEVGWRVVRASRDGSIAVGGSWWFGGLAGDLAGVAKYDASGTLNWYSYADDGEPGGGPGDSLREQVRDLQFDRLGNVYAANFHRSVNGDRTGTTKYNGSTGATVWTEIDALNAGNTREAPNSLTVDPGGNVFNVGFALTGSSTRGQYVIKYTQPYLGITTVQTASASISFEDQSIWAPGAGNLVAETDLFTLSWGRGTFLPTTIDAQPSFTVPILGEFGGGFYFDTAGTIETGLKAEINGGTADVHLPFDLEFVIPPADELAPGQQVTINVEWTPDPAARLTSCFTPTFNAGLTAGVDYDVFANVNLIAFSEYLIDETFIDDAGMIPEDYVPGLNLLDLLSYYGYPTPGEWVQLADIYEGLATVDFRTPQLFAQGSYDPISRSFSTEATDRFYKTELSLTEALLKPFGFTAQIDFEFPQGNTDFKISGDAEALQLRVRAELGARQNIDVGVVPMVRYQISDGVDDQVIPITEDLVFTLPNPFDGQIEIVPTIQSAANFHNTTDLEAFPGIRWTTIEASVAAAAFGFNLLSLGPYCILCFDLDLSQILDLLGFSDPDIVNLALNVFDDSWQIPFDDVRLACMRVLGQTETKPNLVAASRETLSMLIYDQTSPSVSSFNVTTGDNTRMLLYGERLFSDSVAVIEHWGRNELLPTTWINDSTLLVEVPGRFRLLPGVAKLYVSTDGEFSGSIDLPVTFPRPRLDAVNPNLWAADPDLATLPISVIDARSFAGNDTFIARRDYYIKMRDDLWSDVTDGGFVGGAAEYFPDYDFNRLPEFPAVIWGGPGSAKPLPRFVQPVDNGIHNVRLAEDQYDRPQAVPVVICNPGPGGGMSNELILTIAAPVPVVSRISPSNLSPSDIEFTQDTGDPDHVPVAQPIELRVEGPRHVPTFSGYEEPKYGNFNADSVVRLNGVDLPTTFVSSSLLYAELAPADVELGDHIITVSTPSNGTYYFEEKWQDADMDGVRDDEPVFQDLVESGGESVPMLFRIRYRPPRISYVNPSQVAVDAAAFDDSLYSVPPEYNVIIQGEEFRDGSVAYFDGMPRSTTFVGEGILHVKLLPQDVAAVGEFPITVRNPDPDRQFSEPAPFEVFVPSAESRPRWGTTRRPGMSGAIKRQIQPVGP